MKSAIILLLCTLPFFFSCKEEKMADVIDIQGKWKGEISVQGMKLPIIISFKKNNEKYKGLMDSPAQNAKGIEVSLVEIVKNDLSFQIDNINAKYKGTIEGDSIKGIFTQNGMDIPLVLIYQKENQKNASAYPSEEVSFKNEEANINFSGTLSFPQKGKNHPAVVLISGSGPQNRDSELLGHKPFLDLANYLNEKGIAVLRFDERGVGKSEGKFESATSQDFANDVKSAIIFLKNREEIDANKIGLIGHSEGGMIAPMVASEDENLYFTILLAPPVVKGAELLALQTKAMLEAESSDSSLVKQQVDYNKKLYQIIENEEDSTIRRNKIYEHLKQQIKSEELLRVQTEQANSKWIRYFTLLEPLNYLNKMKCKSLALFGNKDVQVTPENYNALKPIFDTRDNQTIIMLDSHNHLFQICETGSIKEYSQINHSYSPKALETIGNWLDKNIMN